MKRYMIFLLFILIVSGCQQSADTSSGKKTKKGKWSTPMKVVHIRGELYLVKGGVGANAAFYISKKSVTVIDAKMTPVAAQLMIKKIKKVTSKPITTIIISHSDHDHVGGLSGFPAGIRIVAHKNSRRHMLPSFTKKKIQSYLPKILITKSSDIVQTGTAKQNFVKLLYFGPAHTDGDLVMFFPKEKAAFIGDLIFLKRDPLIHEHKNGTSFGLVKVLKKILKLNVDTILSGHFEPVTKKEVKSLISSIEQKQKKVTALIKQGKSLVEIKKIFKIREKKGRKKRWPSLVEVIYREIKK